MPAPNIGTGTTIGFGTSSWSADVTSINGNDMNRPALRTSDLSTANVHTFIPGDLVDNGEVEIEGWFDADNVDSNEPPIGGAAETITITFPVFASGGATCAFSGFMTNFSWGVPLEEVMTFSATIKVAGAITWSDGT